MAIKGLWSAEEVKKLRAVMTQEEDEIPSMTWNDRARKAGLQRSGKSCRRRWMNHLRPGLKRGLKFSPHEATLVLQLQEIYGNKWARIAAYLQGRTDNDVKNLWHGCMRSNRAAKLLLNHKPNHHIGQKITLVQGNTGAAMHGQYYIDAVHMVPSLQNHVPTLRTALSSFYCQDYDFMSSHEQACLITSPNHGI